ncbi:MCE family protein [Nocardia panacis]|uniref:MCE family protein n=1 Tax=Nocardia panacis TaxID=2340916 RepID=A0A3A4K3K7_9NOCA|nr:MlaD family protein [Nocardia panacis]RJO79453.1 MCE family protein [Nocardia panacis]
MLKRMLGSQAFMSLAGAAVIVALAVAGYFVVFDPWKKTQAYCAMMSDSIGLYPGNQVTMRGIPVGSVTSVRNQGREVRVDFEVDAKYRVYADAGATTVSDTVVADRSLAVLSSGKERKTWDGAECITNTLTPKSLTETLTALSQLADQLNGSGAAEDNSLAKGLNSLDRATVGTGPQINALIQKLGSALNQPDADIGHLAGIFDTFSEVSKKVTAHWGDLQSMLVRMGPALNQASTELLGPGAELFDALRQVLPVLNDLTTMFGDTILKGLDATVPLVKLLRANVGSLREIVLMTPVLTDAFRTVTDPGTGAPGLTYSPPRVRVPEQNAAAVCAAVNLAAPGRCVGSADGMVDLELTQLVLGMTGAR